MNKILWQIRYTDRRTGLRTRYMGIGFESRKAAEDELRRIKAVQYKRHIFPDSDRIYIVGMNFRISKIKIKSHENFND